MITIATLTGVALFALWYRYAWIMWTDRDIIDLLVKKSKTDFEKYCELPFDMYYVEKCKSHIADLDNWSWWMHAWSTMWGAFIYNFLENKEKYTHLDIAGVANNQFEPYWLYPKGTTGFWVDSLSKLFLGL
jgi:leucyl aminopeptidase